MIKDYIKGDLLKDPSSGTYEASKNLWKIGSENKVEGINRYDAADEVDINRPIRELVENDKTLEDILKLIINNQFSKGIVSGGDLDPFVSSQDFYSISNNSDLDMGVAFTRFSTDKSIPLIIPQDISSSNIDYYVKDSTGGFNSFNTLSDQIIRVQDSLIVGQNGNFFNISSSILNSESAITKTLLLEPWINDTILIDNSDNLINNYKIRIERKANGSSGDIQDKTLEGITPGSYLYFDRIYDNITPSLYESLLTNGFNVGTTDLSDILYFKLNNVLTFYKPAASSNSFWHFVIYNFTTNRMEEWVDSSNPTTTLTSSSRFDNYDNVSSFLTSLGYDYVLLYSLTCDGNGFINLVPQNGYQNCGFSGLTKTSITGLSYDIGTLLADKDYYVKLDIDGSTSTDIHIVSIGDAYSTFDTIEHLLTKMNPLIASAGASIKLINGDLVVFSNTTGIFSSVSILASATPDDLFTSLTGFSAFGSPVAGAAEIPTTRYYIKEQIPLVTTTPMIAHSGNGNPTGSANLGDEFHDKSNGFVYTYTIVGWIRFI